MPGLPETYVVGLLLLPPKSVCVQFIRGFFLLLPNNKKIDSEYFIELSDAEVKELIKPLLIAKKVIRIIKKLSNLCSS